MYPLFPIVSLVPHSTRPAVNAWEVVVAQGNESLDQRDRDRERERERTQRDTHTQNSKKACVVGVGTAGRGRGLQWGPDALGLQTTWPCSLD